MISGTVTFTNASGIIIFGGNYGVQDYQGDSHGTFNMNLPQVRQAPDPIKELETLYSDIGVQMRAEKLMKEVLGDTLYNEFITTQQITIPSKLYPDRYYTIREFGFVQVIDHGQLVEELCVVPKDGAIVTQDVVALKKLMLEGDEKEFLKIANHFQKGVPAERLTPIRRAFRRHFGGR